MAGGYSSSILDAVRRALDASKVLTIQNPEYQTLTFEEVFRLATLGGSQGGTKPKTFIVFIRCCIDYIFVAGKSTGITDTVNNRECVTYFFVLNQMYTSLYKNYIYTFTFFP